MTLDKQEVADLLRREKLCYVATTKQDGSPHVVPMWFIPHDGRIWFETNDDTLKFANIQRRNKVTVVVSGRGIYIAEGSVKWRRDKELDFPFRQLFKKKYGQAMHKDYILEKTYVFELMPERESSWHV